MYDSYNKCIAGIIHLIGRFSESNFGPCSERLPVDVLLGLTTVKN